MASPFNKKVGKDIPKDKADKLMKNWNDKGHKTKSNFFGSDLIQKFLNMDGCVGIRIHYGLDEEGNMQPVITPEVEDSGKQRQSQVFGDSSLGCPPYC
jgi:hypothetical protein